MSDSGVNRVTGRILVIDDDRSARLLLERLLTRAGHQVTLVDTAEQGLEQMGAISFDLIITDKNLPGTNGLELLKRAREKHPALQGILITGFPTAEARHTAEELGVYSYVTKPFGVHDMLGLCDAAVRKAKGLPP